MDLPLRDMDDLQPLFAVVVLYLLALVVLRLFLWPTILELRKRNLLGRLLHVLVNLMTRLLLLAVLGFALVWGLWGIGLQADFTDFLVELPSVEIAELNLVIPGLLILVLILVWFFAIKPALAFFRSRR